MINKLLVLFTFFLIALGCTNNEKPIVTTPASVPQLIALNGASIKILATDDPKLIESEIVFTDNQKKIPDGTQFKVVSENIKVNSVESLSQNNWKNEIFISSNEGKFSFYIKPNTITGLYRVSVYPVDNSNIQFDKSINARYFINIVAGPPVSLGLIKTDLFQDLANYNNIKELNEPWILTSNPDFISYISVGPIVDLYGNLVEEGYIDFSVDKGSILSENPTKILSGYSYFSYKSDGVIGNFNSNAVVINHPKNISISKLEILNKSAPQLSLSRPIDFSGLTIGQSRCEAVRVFNNGSMSSTNLDIQASFPFLIIDENQSDSLCPLTADVCKLRQSLRSGESCALRVKFTMPSTPVSDGDLIIQVDPQEFSSSLLIQKLRTQSVQAAQLISSNPFISFGGTQCSTARTVDIYIQNIGDFDATGIVVQNPPPNPNQSNPFYSIILPPQDVIMNPNLNSIVNCGTTFTAGRKCRVQIQFNPTAGITNQALLGRILGENINPLILSMSGYTIPGNALNSFPINFVTPNNSILPLGMLVGNTQQSRVDVGPIVDACNQRVADGSIISSSVTAGTLLQQTLVSNNGFASFYWNSGNDISNLGTQSVNVSVGVNGSKSGNLLFRGVKLELSGNSDFGQVINGKPKDLIITLTNNGNILAQNLSIIASSPLVVIDRGLCNTNQLSPQASCQITVRADPQGINQDLSVPFTVSSSSFGQSNISLNLTLNARTKPILSFDQDDYLFNDGTLNSVYTRDIILNNEGPAISYETSATLEPPFFIQSTNCTDVLLVNQTCVITVAVNSSDVNLAANKKISISNEVSIENPLASLGFSRLQINQGSILGIKDRCHGPYNISIVGASGEIGPSTSQNISLNSVSGNILFYNNSSCTLGTEQSMVLMSSGSTVSPSFYLKSSLVSASDLIVASLATISDGFLSAQFVDEISLNVPSPNGLISDEKILLTPSGGYGNYQIKFSSGSLNNSYADIIDETTLDIDGNFSATGNKILSVKTISNNQTVTVRILDQNGNYKDFDFNLYQPLSSTGNISFLPQFKTLIPFNNYSNPNTLNFKIQNLTNGVFVDGSLYSSTIDNQGYFQFGSFPSNGLSFSATEYVLIQVSKATGGFTESRVSLNIQCQSNFVLSGNQCLRLINLTVSSLILNYNIYTASLNPTDKVFVKLSITSTGTLGSNSTSLPALTTGSGWALDSIISISNSGKIYGMGGSGGIGGSNFGENTNGGSGGPAIVLQFPVMIDTANGSIFGGGGGGGGSTFYDLVNTLSCGGGGGGGQGFGSSSGGSLGTCWSGIYYPTGTPGNAGSQLSFGTGGSGRVFSTNRGTTVNPPGGNGGSWGQAGSNAGNSYNASNPSVLFNPGKLGGSAGASVVSNGHNLTWISGFDSIHIKGPVQ